VFRCPHWRMPLTNQFACRQSWNHNRFPRLNKSLDRL
jgi:hypothetical protein